MKINSHLGRKLPVEYIDFIENMPKQDFWLTMFPSTGNQFSEEVFLWTEDQIQEQTYGDRANYAYFNDEDWDFSMLQTNSENGTLSEEEIRNSFTFGSLDSGFLFLNLYDGSVWIWYDDMFCRKQADNFSDFIKLLTEEPLDDF